MEAVPRRRVVLPLALYAAEQLIDARETLVYDAGEREEQFLPRQIGMTRFMEIDKVEEILDADTIYGSFRFTADGLRAILDAGFLDGASAKLPKRGRISKALRLLVLLARFVGADRTLVALGDWFRFDAAKACDIFNDTVLFIDDKWAGLLDFDNLDRFSHKFVSYEAPLLSRYRDYDASLQQATSLPHSSVTSVDMAHCMGLFDCTRFQVSRPTHNQRAFFGGKDKLHQVSVGTAMFPDGLFGAVSEVVPGSCNDQGLCHLLGLFDKMAAAGLKCLSDAGFTDCDGRDVIGGMPKPTTNHGFEDTQLKALRSVRVSIEHGYGHLKTKFPYVTDCSKLKVQASPVSSTIRVAFILYNLTVIATGSPSTMAFEMQPPSLSEYLHSLE
jgi:hypothetical protein